ncbi:transposase [Streptomyces humidus]
MPEPWITDPALCRRAGIPQGTEFKTKPRQPMATPARAFAANVPFSRVTADEAYRQVKYLRLWLEAHDAAHVLVTWVNDTQVTPGGHEARADESITGLPARSRRRLSVGAGATYSWRA